MNIFADENIPQQIVTQLRAEGRQVEYVMQQVEDRIILEDAYKQQALLITSDKDFGRLVLDEGKPTAGVLLLRVSTIPIRDRARIFKTRLDPTHLLCLLAYNSFMTLLGNFVRTSYRRA